MAIPASLRREVTDRALGRCEYCGLSQAGQEAAFHVDHILPILAAGATTGENLAFACVSCSLRKGARLTTLDPDTGEQAPLFHPRRDLWQVHFRWDGVRIIGTHCRGSRHSGCAEHESITCAFHQRGRGIPGPSPSVAPAAGAMKLTALFISHWQEADADPRSFRRSTVVLEFAN